MERSWERLLTKYGPIVGIALFLVWILASDLSGGVREIQDTLQNHVSETNYYLRQICLNTSDTEGERAACVGIR